MTAFVGFIPLALSLADPGANGLAAEVQSDYRRWERRLRARVAELHHFPTGAEIDATGTVAVNFAIGSDGRATDITVERSSNHALFDRAASRLVRQLGSVGRVPSNSGRNHRVTLKLTYGGAPIVDRKYHDNRNLELVSSGPRRVAKVSHSSN